MLRALALNPGLPDGARLFSYIGFKGGSEPGVLTLSFLVRRASDQAWRFYSLETSDPSAALDEDRIEYLAGAGRASPIPDRLFHHDTRTKRPACLS